MLGGTRSVLVTAGVATALAIGAGSAQAVIPGAGVISKKNIEWRWNNPQLVGSDIEFFERKLADGTLKRYAIPGAIGHGFQIVDITDPARPLPAGAFVDPGANYQGDTQVNPRRNIAVIATDGAPAATVGHGGVAAGATIVDISNVQSPTLLSTVRNIGGAHNTTIVDDRYIYTALPTRIIDYSDPRSPQLLPANRASFICGHDLTVDPNNPDRLYSACSSGNRWQIVDIADPANPTLIADVRDTSISIPHQADPAPDSSFVVVTDERGGGVTNEMAPGGGAHIYDISGKYIPGASETNPKKMGLYFAPFNGVSANGDQAGAWGNVTMHVMTFQAERFLLSTAWYSMGSWVADMQDPTNEAANGQLYDEWDGNQFAGNNGTTWGNTQGNLILEGDDTWSTKWTRFDDPVFDRYLFTNGLTRGMDTLFYTGALPKKVARLAVDPEATDGALRGKLDRYAVWTYEGWVNKPLAGKAVALTVDGQSAGTATTAADGSFELNVPGLRAGEHEVTARWAGDGTYQPAEATETVTAVPPSADLSLTQTGSPDPVTVGDPLSYTLEVTNAGPDPAEAVVVTDTLPSGAKLASSSPGCDAAGGVLTCALGTIADGASETVAVTVVPQEPAALANHAAVTSSTRDPNGSNNLAEVVTQATCTITGTAGADTLQGTAGRDVICGLGGADTLRGLGGDDLVVGGDGADKVQGSDGNDELAGGPGNDELKGADGDDTLAGGAGVDALNGGPGVDTCARDAADPAAKECEQSP